MKKMKWMLALAAIVLAAAACGQKKAEGPKYLVLYYSQTSNTKAVAEQIAGALGADIEAILPVVPYDGTYQETLERCGQERASGILPEVQPLKADLSKYDVIFLGYPIWYGEIALPMASMLKQIDLSGKKVVPFCSFGSGGLESGMRELAAKQPGAEILPGYGVRAARVDAIPAEVDQFLKAGGFLEGEFFKAGEFPEPHPVTAEEAAIFDAAISTYPMMQGTQAATVTSRPLPNGTEYLFTAGAGRPPQAPPQGAAPQRPQGAPQGAAPQRPPQGAPQAMKIYVTVANGEAPVFTRVDR